MRRSLDPLPHSSAEPAHWVEIFAERAAEDLKRILQDDMDWTTSIPILERLNRLYEIEEARRRHDDPHDDRHAPYRLAS
ncbi:hypothetical protein [Hyphomicrobium sp. MC1]|uniref:hypothetical protein n=1 Tax=Hyphomicrobium sp. (strain MC1) TaxID=717785 RepID=UPI001AEC3256|nr:hypothetical protein [Hyphomicrobium sp. MC1]